MILGPNPISRPQVSAKRQANAEVSVGAHALPHGSQLQFCLRPGRRGRLSALSVFLCKSGFYDAFVWARRALNGLKRRFPVRAVAMAKLLVKALVGKVLASGTHQRNAEWVMGLHRQGGQGGFCPLSIYLPWRSPTDLPSF